MLECENEWSGGKSVRENGEGVPASVMEGGALHVLVEIKCT